jgi:hypothetical protein
MAGAQVRATSAALDEEFDPLRSDLPPRGDLGGHLWRGRDGRTDAGCRAWRILGGTDRGGFRGAAWIGALDVLVVAGDDAVDPVLVSAAATGTRRVRVIVVASQGVRCDVAAGRAVVLEPRLQVPDDFAGLLLRGAGHPARGRPGMR